MKLPVSVTLFVFWAVVVSALTAGFVFNDRRTTPGSNVRGETLTAEVVALHNTASDCWLIIRGGVYDVTSFINQHPGGSARIVGQCGKDATTAFETQGGRGAHSPLAEQQLASLKIGELGQNTPGTAPTPNPTTPPAVTDEDDENEDNGRGRGRGEDD